ncbi:LamG domain-containing protein [Flavitalea antarctica]
MKLRHYISGMLMVTATTTLIIACEKDMEEYAPERPIGGYNSSAEVGTENRVAHWAFEGGLNDSVGGASATAKSVTFAAGKKGQGLKGAASGYALVEAAPAKIVSLQSFTIAFWMNTPQQTGAAAGLFALNNNKDFWGSLDVYMEPYAQNNVPNPDTAFMKVHINNDNVKWKGQFIDAKIGGAINKWIHIAATYDGTTSVFNLYANGQSIGVNSAGNPANTKGPKLRGDDPATSTLLYGPIKFVNATQMVFGTFQFQTTPSMTTSASAQTWAQSFTGILDEFRIYDKALSSGDVNALFKLEGLGR